MIVIIKQVFIRKKPLEVIDLHFICRLSRSDRFFAQFQNIIITLLYAVSLQQHYYLRCALVYSPIMSGCVVTQTDTVCR